MAPLPLSLPLATSTDLPDEWAQPGSQSSSPPPAILGMVESLSAMPLHPGILFRLPTVIGISGKPGAGKDTVAWIAAIIVGASGKRVRVLGTSDPIVAEANEMLAPWGREIGHANKSWPPYRALLQDLGKLRREGDPTYWNRAHVRAIQSQVEADLALPGCTAPVIFITGLRTPSDLAMVQEPPLAGAAVRVYRAGNPYTADHWIERQLDHVGDDAFEYVIHNSENDIMLLVAQVRRMLIALASDPRHPFQD